MWWVTILLFCSVAGAAHKKSCRASLEEEAPRDPLNAFYRYLKSFPLLSEQEEKELAGKMIDGRQAEEQLRESGSNSPGFQGRVRVGKEAESRLAISILRLVPVIANRYKKTGVPMEDLIGYGNLGVARALKTFDLSHDTRLSTYASYWIEHFIRRGAREWRPISVPTEQKKQLHAMATIREQIARDEGRMATLGELLDQLPMSKKQRERVMCAMEAQQPLLDVNGGSNPDGSLECLLADPDFEREKKRETEAEMATDLIRLIDKLDARLATLIKMRFGLEGAEESTLKEIGQRLGLTPERVRQLEVKALRSLAYLLRSSDSAYRDFTGNGR